MLKILIADDEVIERTVLEKRLKKYYSDTCTILVAQNGRQALEIYEQDHPQVMIFDIEMPGINGLEAAKEIRRRDRRSGSIIFLTAFDEFSYAKAAISVHALDYLLKPCDERELINAVDEAIRLSRVSESKPYAEEPAAQNTPPAQKASEEQTADESRHEETLAYIAQHYMEDLAVKDIAGYLGYSEAYFCKLFKQSFGHSFVSYLTDYRMQQAEELMRTSRLSIKDIGKAVGYPDPNYFTKVFRRVRGVSPSEFRESGVFGNQQ
jgi:YesN/AraC family two-component response regulator